VEAPRAGRAMLLGGILGLAAHARAEALMLLPLLLLPLLRRPGGLRAAGLAVLAFAVVLTPWTVRNWSAFDRPVLIATEGGETLAGANCPPMYSGPRIGTWSVLCVKFNGRGNEAVELNRAGHDGIRYARDNLGRLPVVGAVRVLRTWSFYAPFDDVPEGRRAWVMDLGVALYFVLLPLGAYGLWLLRTRPAQAWMLAAPLVTVTLSSLLSYGAVRFRHSAELSIVVLAAVAADQLWRLARRRRGLTASI
jgi:hypothetical protein